MARSTSSPVTAPGTAIDAAPGRALALYQLLAPHPARVRDTMAGLDHTRSLAWDFQVPVSGALKGPLLLSAISSQPSLSVLELWLPADS